MNWNRLLLVFLSLNVSLLQAQAPNPPLFDAFRAAKIHEIGNATHSSILPLNPFDTLDTGGTIGELQDSLQQKLRNESDFANQKWLGRKLFNEHFIHIKGKDDNYSIILNPLMNLRLGRDDNWADKNPYQNTRGIQLMGSIGEKFIFYSDFWENQVRFPQYVQNFVDNSRVVPGQGTFKAFDQSEVKDFAYANGHIAYQPSKYFNFQLGHGKHFLGDGYRSLLLSDNTFNYPYFRITAQFWKIKYWVLYSKMLDINNTYPDGTFFNKYMTAHYLSFNLTKRLNVGLFETIIYGDETGTRGYDINYLNPIIFFRPVEFSLGSRGGNALLGLNLKYKLTNKLYAYGQVSLDEFKLTELRKNSGWWANKYGIQLGIKSFDTFVEGLTFQTEFNTVRPYTYSHLKEFQNYGHYNQALAHPLGSNFMESVTRISYQKKRIFAEAALMLATQGRDTLNSNWGTDIFISYGEREQDYGNETLQGIQATTLFADLKLGYVVNPSYNLRVELGYTYRQFTPETELANLQSHTTNYMYIGLVTRLQNHYYDF